MPDDFRKNNKTSSKAFTRDRLLPFQRLIYLLLNMNNNSYQDELDRFYKTLFRYDVAQRVIYKSNLTKARKKLDYKAFEELNDHMIDNFYQNFKHQRWYGFNLLAIDGTTIRVPDEKPIVDHFGAWKANKGTTLCPKARASQMFDVLNKVTVDAILSPKSDGERELAAFHFLKLQPNDMLLLDRGYPAHWIFQAILSLGAQFCARISYKKWKVVQKFYKSGKAEKNIRIHPTAVSKQKCEEMGFDTTAITARLIRVQLDSGETEILITSLTDMEAFPKRIVFRSVPS